MDTGIQEQSSSRCNWPDITENVQDTTSILQGQENNEGTHTSSFLRPADIQWRKLSPHDALSQDMTTRSSLIDNHFSNNNAKLSVEPLSESYPGNPLFRSTMGTDMIKTDQFDASKQEMTSDKTIELLQHRLNETQQQLEGLQRYFRGFQMPIETMVNSQDAINLERENQLLKQKITALEEIIELQEKDIASNIPADEDNDNCDSSSNDSISLAQIVLNRWRQEVFSRMLVCMSLTTEMEDARRDYKQQIAAIEKKLEKESHQHQMVELRLNARSVDLNQAVRYAKVAEARSAELSEQLAQVTAQLDKERENHKSISDVVSSVVGAVTNQMDEMQAASDKANLLIHRINFAEGRISTISHFLKKRLANSCSIGKEKTISEEYNTYTMKRATSPPPAWKSRLELEVEQLARERNALLKENSDLSSRFEQRVKNVEDKYEKRIQHLEERLHQLDAEKNTLEQQIAQLSTEIQQLQQTRYEMENETERMRKQYDERVHQLEHNHLLSISQIKDAQQEEKSHLQERISTLEHDLAARNVQIKQMERQLSQTRAQTELDAMNQLSSYKNRIAELTATVQRLTEEKNVLSVRLQNHNRQQSFKRFDGLALGRREYSIWGSEEPEKLSGKENELPPASSLEEEINMLVDDLLS